MKKFKDIINIFLLILIFNISPPYIEGAAPPKKPPSTLYVIESKKIALHVHGMFSCFLMGLGALDLYDKNKANGLWINLNVGLYFDPNTGPNWWNYYFKPIHLFPSPPYNVVYYSYKEVERFAFDTLFTMSRQRGNELINKYVHVQAAITNEVNAFVNTHFSNRYVIGIHYRGTDKSTEVERIPYQSVELAIKETIRGIPQELKDRYSLFIATDEWKFIEFIQQKFSCPVLFIDAYRSNDNFQPVHFTHFNNYMKGKEALLDCLLLSKCNFLLRTESNLSFAASLFNPHMPVRFLTSRWLSPELDNRSKNPH